MACDGKIERGQCCEKEKRQIFGRSFPKKFAECDFKAEKKDERKNDQERIGNKKMNFFRKKFRQWKVGKSEPS